MHASRSVEMIGKYAETAEEVHLKTPEEGLLRKCISKLLRKSTPTTASSSRSRSAMCVDHFYGVTKVAKYL
jgi:hypothetical protein